MVHLSALGFALAAASVLVPGVLSQSIPACATSCATSAAGSAGCDPANTSCLCASQTFATDAGQCIGSTCDSTDLQAAEAYFESLCTGATASTSTDTSTDTTTDTSTTTTATVPLVTTTTSPTTTVTTPTTTSTHSPTTTTTTPTTTATSTSTTTSKSNQAMLHQPTGVLGAGIALGLVLFA